MSYQTKTANQKKDGNEENSIRENGKITLILDKTKTIERNSIHIRLFLISFRVRNSLKSLSRYERPSIRCIRKCELTLTNWGWICKFNALIRVHQKLTQTYTISRYFRPVFPDWVFFAYRSLSSLIRTTGKKKYYGWALGP